MNFEELQEQGWSDFQQVDGQWWGFPPGAVMPVPVGRSGSPLSDLIYFRNLSHRHEGGWPPDISNGAVIEAGEVPPWGSEFAESAELPESPEAE